jgi:hypothetical protein
VQRRPGHVLSGERLPDRLEPLSSSSFGRGPPPQCRREPPRTRNPRRRRRLPSLPPAPGCSDPR